MRLPEVLRARRVSLGGALEDLPHRGPREDVREFARQQRQEPRRSVVEPLQERARFARSLDVEGLHERLPLVIRERRSRRGDQDERAHPLGSLEGVLDRDATAQRAAVDDRRLVEDDVDRAGDRLEEELRRDGALAACAEAVARQLRDDDSAHLRREVPDEPGERRASRAETVEQHHRRKRSAAGAVVHMQPYAGDLDETARQAATIHREASELLGSRKEASSHGVASD